MNIHNSKLIISNFLKERPFFVTASLDSITRRMFSSKVSQKVFDSDHFLESIFETSVKPYIDKSKIHLLDNFLKPLNNRRSVYNFVIDEGVAKDIAEKIILNTNIKKSYIIEGNPGLGLITLNLMSSGGHHLCLCDNSELKNFSINKILQNHANQVKLKNCNINSGLSSVILSSLDEAKNKKKTVILIGVTSSFYILRILVNVFLKNKLWKTPFDIYLVISSLAWKSTRRLDPLNFKYVNFCGFNLLFKTKKLASYPCNAFLPVLKSDDGDFVFVRISVKPNIFTHFKEEELMDYINFVSILGRSAYNLIIPTLEKWLPDCGPYLISKGISMSNRTIDLSYSESVTLFKLLKNFEGYSDFRTVIRSFQN